MVTSGFFNSDNGDRKYFADDFGTLWDGMITDGVIMHVGNRLIVKHYKDLENQDLTVWVETGKAWFNRSYLYNDTMLPINIPENTTTQTVWHAVVMEFNRNFGVRKNDIKLVSGTPGGGKPTFASGDRIKIVPLAYIQMPPGATSVGYGQTQIENCVGTTVCPFATCLLEKLDADDLIQQWKDQFDLFMSGSSTYFTNTINTLKADFEAMQTEKENSFDQMQEDKRQEMDTLIGDAQIAFEAEMNRERDLFAATLAEEKDKFDAEIAASQTEFDTFLDSAQNEFNTWFDGIKDLLEDTENLVANMAAAIEDLSSRMSDLEIRVNQTTSELNYKIEHIYFDQIDPEQILSSISSFTSNDGLVIYRRSNGSEGRIVRPATLYIYNSSDDPEHIIPGYYLSLPVEINQWIENANAMNMKPAYDKNVLAKNDLFEVKIVNELYDKIITINNKAINISGPDGVIRQKEEINSDGEVVTHDPWFSVLISGLPTIKYSTAVLTFNLTTSISNGVQKVTGLLFNKDGSQSLKSGDQNPNYQKIEATNDPGVKKISFDDLKEQIGVPDEKTIVKKENKLIANTISGFYRGVLYFSAYNEATLYIEINESSFDDEFNNISQHGVIVIATIEKLSTLNPNIASGLRPLLTTIVFRKSNGTTYVVQSQTANKYISRLLINGYIDYDMIASGDSTYRYTPTVYRKGAAPGPLILNVFKNSENDFIISDLSTPYVQSTGNGKELATKAYVDTLKFDLYKLIYSNGLLVNASETTMILPFTTISPGVSGVTSNDGGQYLLITLAITNSTGAIYGSSARLVSIGKTTSVVNTNISLGSSTNLGYTLSISTSMGIVSGGVSGASMTLKGTANHTVYYELYKLMQPGTFSD